MAAVVMGRMILRVGEPIYERNYEIHQIFKALKSTLEYTDKAAMAIAKGLGSMASTAAQIFKVVASSPVWDDIDNFRDNMNAVMNAVDMRYRYKKAIKERWRALDHELKNHNRYFPKSDFLPIFDECTAEAGLVLRKGSLLYRAREIETGKITEPVSNFLSALENEIDDSMHDAMIDNSNVWDHIDEMSYEEWVTEYVDAYGLLEVSFWGYDASDSDAPPSWLAGNVGRANPPFISYLYSATGSATAIAEIQPMIGEVISVATIKTKRKLKLFSFDFHESMRNNKLYKKPIKEFEALTGKPYWMFKVFFDTLSELFSRPSLGNPSNYFVTQYLSEYIKSRGYDGLKFKSSLKKGGFNVVLFDTSKGEDGESRNYEVVGSHLHYVKNVTVKSSRVLPKLKKV